MPLIRRWARVDPWEPTSSKQVLEYMRSKGYEIPKHRKTKKPTTDEDSLEKILRKHPEDPVLPKVLEGRRLQKGMGYLADTYLGRDGRLHPEYTRHPETLRVSSRRPNLQNIPQGRKAAERMVAEAIRSSIIASPGFTLMERDYRAEEALLLGYFAEDESYMRLARLGLYSYFVGIKVGRTVDLTLPDADVKKQLNAIKKDFPVIYPIMKKTILARGYGEGVYAIARDLEPFFWDEAKELALTEAAKRRWWTPEIAADPFMEAKVVSIAVNIMVDLAKTAANDYVKIYESAAPKVVAWQESTRRRAHKERKLTNPYGYVRQFFDVYRKDGSLGSEANKALAFLPQSTGSGILTEDLIEIDKLTAGDPDFYLLVPVHDAALAEAKIEATEHYSALMRSIMEAPKAALGGLKIETEAKVGQNWGLMKEAA
jgi:DNA polymerase I-like protein with 3'-5' exonuclease and polymerase domains